MSKIVFELVLQDVNAQQAIAKFRQEVKDANAEIKKGVGADRFKELTEKIATAKIETLKLTDEQKKLRKEFAATQVPTDSLAGLRIAYSKVTEQVNRLSKAERESDFGRRLISRGAGLKTQIDGIEQSLGRFTGNVGNYKSALLGIGDIITGGLATGGIFALIQGFTRLGQRIVDTNAQVSDSVADVAKAANTSIDAVNKLADRLEGRDTRTSLLDQLDIAKIGGQLGVAEKDLFGFVEAIDIVNVALGDQFGGSVEKTTESIAGLRNILKDVQTDNVGQDIVNIGNALNFLEAEGIAGASAITDFTGRIGGIGQSLGISAGKILGVSTTLAELNVNAERGSSGFIRLIQQVALAPEAFAKAADVPAKEFKDLVNNDIFGAVELFLSKLNDKNLSNTELTSVLDSLKVDGVGAGEVVAKLGANTDLLGKRVKQATEQLRESGSVTQEFEKKNLTLGASLDLVSNAISNILTSSSVGGGLAGFFRNIALTIDELSEFFDKLTDTTAATTGAARANEIFSNSILEASIEIEKSNIATEKSFNILRDGRATQEQRQTAINDLVKLYPSLLTQQQLEAANIQQLNGLQELSTNVLRTQVTERLKLRAKEQLETEIVQKKIRQVELDATSDRALLAELTAGETLRNFGTLDPAKLRKQLRDQFNRDIVELESGLRKVDQTFETLQKSAEDNLSAAEQDALDLFRQFNEGSSEATKSLILTTGANENLGTEIDKLGKKNRKTKEDVDLVVGSLAFFRDQIDKLKKELDNTPAESPLFKKLQQNIIDAELALDSLQEKLNAQLDPADIATPTLPTVGGITVPVSLEVENEDDALKGLKDFQKRANENAAKIKSEADEEQAIKDAEKREQVEEAIKEAALNTAQAISNGIFEIQRSRQEREKNEALTALDEETARRIEQAQGNATLIEQIEKDADKKRAQIEKEAAQRAKRLALQQAAIDTALAILKALASAAPPFNFILAGAAAVAGAIQLAVIKKQEFAGGGRVKKLGSGIINEQPNHPRTAKGDNVLALVKSGEMILNEEQQARLEAITGTGIYSRIGVPLNGVTSKLVPQFANGGFASDFTPQIALPQVGGGQAIVVQTVAEISDAQMDMLAAKVAAQTGRATKEGVGEGLEDNNRLKERQESLIQNREA